jgi:hypothetical protein
MRFLLAAGGVAMVTFLSGGTMLATAAPSPKATSYCINGVTIPPPAWVVSASSVSAGSITVDMDEAWAAEILYYSPTGVFYFGYIPGSGWHSLEASGDPNSVFEPGYSTNYLSRGACQLASGPKPARVAVCKRLPRGDGTTGMFQDITVAEWNDKDGQYFDASAANWVEGLGLTCDNPLALGYKSAGYNVAWGGQPDPGNDPNGVRASGFNNIYPYFIK